MALATSPPLDSLPHERRFVLRREQARSFIKSVARWVTLEVYDAERPLAFTRTTYLDTANLAYLRSCEDGPVAKRLRIREYADSAAKGDPPLLSGRCFLELKVSRGHDRRKARFEAPPDVIRDLVDSRGRAPAGWARRLQRVEAFDIILEHLRAHRLAPRLTTWYRRAALTGEGGRVRITIDERISFCLAATPGHAGEPAEPAESLGRGPGRIVEVKYDDRPPHWLTHATRGLKESPSLSKFRLGMKAIQRSGISRGWRTTDLRAVPGYLCVEAADQEA